MTTPTATLTISSPTSGTDCTNYAKVVTSGLVVPSGTLTLSDATSGTDCSSYKTVKTSGLVVPSGTKSITSNGTYDVSSYASASVSVSQKSIVTSKSFTLNSGSSGTSSYSTSISISDILSSAGISASAITANNIIIQFTRVGTFNFSSYYNTAYFTMSKSYSNGTVYLSFSFTNTSGSSVNGQIIATSATLYVIYPI